MRWVLDTARHGATSPSGHAAPAAVAVLLVGALGACVAGQAPSGAGGSSRIAHAGGSRVAGAPADRKTAAGEHDGFRVFVRCRTDLGVAAALVGSGERPCAFAAHPDDHVVLEAFRTRALGLLAGLSSVHGSGFGTPCQGEKLAFHVALSDWREVDEAIRRLGNWLRDERSGGEIVLFVRGGPIVL